MTREPQMGFSNCIENREGTTPELIDGLKFVDQFEQYFICVVHILDFAKIFNSRKIGKFYAKFVNCILEIVKKHNGVLLRTVHDDTIFYFPNTSNWHESEAIQSALECCLAIISSRSKVNKILVKEELPEISYNVSAEYGNLVIYRSEKSISFDLFGGLIKFCREMKKLAPTSSIIVGQDVYVISNHFLFQEGRYHFQKVRDMSLKGRSLSYPLYLVSKEGEMTNFI